MKILPTIVHFDLPSDNIERTTKFYSELFGWRIEKMPGMDDSISEEKQYFIISTTDENGNEALSGGVMKRQGPQHQGITNYIDVKSIDESSSKIQQLGGKVIMQKTPVPTNMGYFAVCLDTENNIFGIWETDNNAK